MGTLYTWNVFSPRLGVTSKLTGDGRTVLRGSYGMFHQGLLTGEFAAIHPGATPTTTAAFDAATGGYTTLVKVDDPRINLQIDPETRSPRTDEYSIGVDREVGRRLAVAIAYVGKKGSNFIGWTDVGGQYREVPRTLPDGRTVTVFELANSQAARRFLLTNPEGYSLMYNGLVMAVEKRRSDGWQAFGTYTFSRVSGLQASSGSAAAGAQVSSVAGATQLTFGQDPNSLINARGRLPNDRPHMFRVMGIGGRPTHRPGGRGQSPAFQRQAVRGVGAADAAAGQPARAARAARLTSNVVAIVAQSARVENVRLRRRGTHRAARGRAQCAQ